MCGYKLMRALSVIFLPFLAPSYAILPLFSPASASLFFSSKQNFTNITSCFPLHPDRHHHLLISFMFQTPSSASSPLVYFLPSSVKPAFRHHHHQSSFCMVSLPCVAVSRRCWFRPPSASSSFSWCDHHQQLHLIFPPCFSIVSPPSLFFFIATFYLVDSSPYLLVSSLCRWWTLYVRTHPTIKPRTWQMKHL